jgi:outer membrane biosynthesis protein TonB
VHAAIQPRAYLGGRRSFGAVGAVVLASGVLIGAAVGPALTPASFAATAGQLIVVATGGSGGLGSAASQALGGGAAGTSGGLTAPTGNVAAPPKRVVNLGAGGAAAPQPATAAGAPATTAPTTPAPATPTPTPTPTTPPADPTISGTVVHVSHSGHGYTLATKDGQLISLHASKVPVLGDKVKATVLALQNGTFQQRAEKHLGHAGTATFHGTVTYSDQQAGVYTVSVRGVSLLVHLPPPTDPSAPPVLVPAVATITTVDVAFRPAPGPPAPPPPDPASPTPDPAAQQQPPARPPPVSPPPPPPQLVETKRQDGVPATGELDLEGIVRPPDPANPDPSHLVVSADDAGESTATLSLRVPPKLDVSKLTPGKVIMATVKREADGSYTLVTAFDDTDRKAADQAP